MTTPTSFTETDFPSSTSLLRPPKGGRRGPIGPAETGRLTPHRSRSASRSSNSSVASNLTPSGAYQQNTPSPSKEAVNLEAKIAAHSNNEAGGGGGQNSNIKPSTTSSLNSLNERSRSSSRSGRMTVPGASASTTLSVVGGGSDLKRGSAASDSTLLASTTPSSSSVVTAASTTSVVTAAASPLTPQKGFSKTAVTSTTCATLSTTTSNGGRLASASSRNNNSTSNAKSPTLLATSSSGGKHHNSSTKSPSQQPGGLPDLYEDTSAVAPGSTAETGPKGSKKFLNKWRDKASMSKFGKGTKSLLGKWKHGQSQSVDVISSQHRGDTYKVIKDADSLDSGLQGPLIESELGSGQENHHSSVEKEKPSQKNGTTTTTSSHPEKSQSNFSKMTSRMKQSSRENKIEEVEKPKASWSEHVWTAWVHRGFTDDVTEITKIEPCGDLLTDFQKDKYRYFFLHVLDLNSDYVISAEDFVKLNERIRHYMDWSLNSVQFLALKELHETFLDCFLTTASKFDKKKDEGDSTPRNPQQMFENWKLGFPIGTPRLPPSNHTHSTSIEHNFDYWDPFKRLDSLYDKMDGNMSLADALNAAEPEKPKKLEVTMEEWIDVWGTIVGKAKRMDDFPMWLQYYPKVLFDIINRSGTGTITKNELKYFYTAFMDAGKLGDQKLEEFTNDAYRNLTANGDHKLTFHIYRLSFLNFLLGKQPNGPGQYLFGTVTPQTRTCMFPIDYSAMNSTEEDLEPYRPDKLLEKKGSRRSVLV